MGSTPTMIVHFYRATVMHADVWRRRLDVTTNWSIVSTVGIVTYAFSDPLHPHIALLLSIPFLGLFLLMESRRYQMYDLWRHRVRLLNRYIVAPAFSPEGAPSDERVAAELGRLARALGTSVPRLTRLDAMGYRLRRNYGFLGIGILLMWFIKLAAHPGPADTVIEVIDRARVAWVPGGVIMALVIGVAVGSLYVALRAPTERMEDWFELPSPLEDLVDSEAERHELTLLPDNEA